MSFTLSNLKPARGSRTSSKRIGRGAGSGHGTTAGRGTKGQLARTGGRNKLKRMGLKRIMQRIPKLRGFTSLTARLVTVNVGDLQDAFGAGAKITPQALQKAELVRDISSGVKILGDGTLTKALTVKECAVSKSAKEKIEKAGGQIE